MPSQKELNDLFIYDQSTGHLINRKSRSSNALANHVAGHPRPGNNHTVLHLQGSLYLAHRLIWVMLFGSIPEGRLIDHIDGDTHNNRLENLRLVDHQLNGQNCRLSCNSTTGHLGVYWSERNRYWWAQIMVNRKHIWLGRFDIKDEAIEARKLAEEQYGFHPNHGSIRPQILRKKNLRQS